MSTLRLPPEPTLRTKNRECQSPKAKQTVCESAELPGGRYSDRESVAEFA